jgi:hypothetical protein
VIEEIRSQNIRWRKQRSGASFCAGQAIVAECAKAEAVPSVAPSLIKCVLSCRLHEAALPLRARDDVVDPVQLLSSMVIAD